MRFYKEPLFHFILIGLAIFGWFYLVSDEAEPPVEAETITIDSDDIALLRTRFEASWKRQPTDAELQALIDSWTREEILVREARKLGLDRGDQVIRARLARKMEFLTTAIASSVAPEEAVLEEHLAQNADRFTTPTLIAFDQVYLGDAPDPDVVDDTLQALNGGADWSSLGVSSLLARSMPLTAAGAIDTTFGRGFASQLDRSEPMIWVGPINSGYGQHLVRVTEAKPGYLPPLAEIYDSVLNDWRRATAQDLAQAQYESLAARYRVETPESKEGGS
ncbi:peptidyl-prolyl cis-trans isomerase [Ruegeria arenilitoris]|uniref:peptidylprolyl isomerase n=1 Tax=Ruegeria arenilitoris TaxID=1173585 RepID=UPI00147E7F18|nr:peptidylprolyl isomerase [Ruegeria arenilitoris]